MGKKFLYFDGYCFGYATDVSGPVEILDTYTIEDIAESLKDDMGLDYNEWLKNKHLDRDFWVNHYARWAKFWEDTEKEGMEDLNKMIAILDNKDPEKAENIATTQYSDNSTRKKISFYSLICAWSYQLMSIFFVFAIISMGVGYICSNG